MASAQLLQLSEPEKKDLLGLARETLEWAFRDKPSEALALFTQKHPADGPFSAHLGAFVSLFLKNRLRGCIGNLQSEGPLTTTIHKMALQAAFHDPRFKPLEGLELPAVNLHISVLGPVTPLEDLEKLILGRQGLVVSYRGQRGVLLADVATRFRWDQTTFLRETCHKAGLPPERVSDYTIEYFDDLSFSE